MDTSWQNFTAAKQVDAEGQEGISAQGRMLCEILLVESLKGDWGGRV